MTELTPTENDLLQEIARRVGERQFWDDPATAEETIEIILGYPEADIRRAMLTSTMPKPWPGNLRKQLGSAGRPDNGIVANHLRYTNAEPSTPLAGKAERFACLTCGQWFRKREKASLCGRSHSCEDMNGEAWLALRGRR